MKRDRRAGENQRGGLSFYLLVKRLDYEMLLIHENSVSSGT
jgi:hypothetical protein